MKKNYLRNLLVAGVLAMGTTGVYADDTYDEVYVRDASTWTATDAAAWSTSANIAVSDSYGLGFNPVNPTGSYEASQTFAVSENAKVKYVVMWRTGSSTARANNFEYIQFGDKVRLSYNSTYNYYLNVDGQSTAGVQFDNNRSVRDNAITIVFNTATKSVETFSFNGKDLTDKVTGTLDGDFNRVSFGFLRGGRGGNWEYPNYLKAITVSECKQEVSTRQYAINYVANGKTVANTEGELAVGATVMAEKAVVADGVKYIVDASMVPSMTITADGNNVLAVPVRKPYKATLVLNTTVGTETTSETINLVESDDHDVSWSYAYPLYRKGGDVYYEADETAAFGERGTFADGEVITKNVRYAKADASVVYYADASSAPGMDYACSNGEFGHVESQNARNRGLSVGVLSPGTYDFVVNFMAVNKRSLVLRSGVEDPIAALMPTKKGVMSTMFTLGEETSDLFVNGANVGETKTNQSEEFDYVLIKKKDIPTVEINAASKVASYSSAQTVTVPEDVMIYIATETSASEIVLTKVEGRVVPANTGVVLYSATPGMKTLAYGGEATADFAANKFVATGDATFAATGSEYALVKGEQSFAKVAAGVEIPANKAYVVAAAGAKLNLDFGTLTAIEGVEAAAADSDAIYNLAGQKVSASYKGIVVKGGKKYIVK